MRQLSFSRAHGMHGSGGKAYTSQQREVVLNYVMPLIGRKNRRTYEQVQNATGVPGRTARAIVGDEVRARRMFAGGGVTGVYVAEYAEEGERAIRTLEAQIKTQQARVDSMKAMLPSLPRQMDRLL